MVENFKSFASNNVVRGALGISLVLSLQLSAVAQSVHKTPKDSFLTQQVNSVNGLVNEIKTNPVVRSHYAKLYHLSGTTVANYFQNNVEIGHLVHKYPHTVYCVTPNGVVFTARETLRTDEKVFALKSGQPVLRWACGNPLSASLPMASRTADAGLVVFTGSQAHHTKAALKPTNGRHLKPHGLPLQQNVATVPAPTQVVIPSEKVATYVSTLQPSAPVTPAVVGVPANFSVPIGTAIPLHIPLTPFLAALPLALINTHSSGFSTSDSQTPPGDTTGGGTGTTGGGTGTTGGGTGTTGGGTGTTGGTTGTTGGGTTTVAPEPSSIVTWSLAGLFLVLGIAVGKKRRQPVPVKVKP